jgi:hypothetical protein
MNPVKLKILVLVLVSHPRSRISTDRPDLKIRVYPDTLAGRVLEYMYSGYIESESRLIFHTVNLPRYHACCHDLSCMLVVSGYMYSSTFYLENVKG